MRISDWSSDVCSSDLRESGKAAENAAADADRGVRWAATPGADGEPCQTAQLADRIADEEDADRQPQHIRRGLGERRHAERHAEGSADEKGRCARPVELRPQRSEEHTSELQSLMRISSAVFCLKN